MVALVPLSFADMDRTWSETIHCYDASLVGYGVASAQADPREVGLAGRRRERVRFRHGGAPAPRQGSKLRQSLVDEKVSVPAISGMVGLDVLVQGRHTRFAEVPKDLVEDLSWQTV